MMHVSRTTGMLERRRIAPYGTRARLGGRDEIAPQDEALLAR
jgi:hypothetical protein